MPSGVYKGLEMEKVPAEHLLMLAHFGKAKQGVREYINENFTVLVNELKIKNEEQ